MKSLPQSWRRGGSGPGILGVWGSRERGVLPQDERLLAGTKRVLVGVTVGVPGC